MQGANCCGWGEECWGIPQHPAKHLSHLLGRTQKMEIDPLMSGIIGEGGREINASDCYDKLSWLLFVELLLVSSLAACTNG